MRSDKVDHCPIVMLRYNVMIIVICSISIYRIVSFQTKQDRLLPRCMECRSGRAAWNAMRILSVRLSVKRVHCDKTEERSVQIFIPYERSFSLVTLSEKKNGCWGRPLLSEILGQPVPAGAKSPNFEPIFACSASAVTPGL